MKFYEFDAQYDEGVIGANRIYVKVKQYLNRECDLSSVKPLILSWLDSFPKIKEPKEVGIYLHYGLIDTVKDIANIILNGDEDLYKRYAPMLVEMLKMMSVTVTADGKLSGASLALVNRKLSELNRTVDDTLHITGRHL